MDDRGGPAVEPLQGFLVSEAGPPQLGKEAVLRIPPTLGRSAMQDRWLAQYQRELQVPAEVRDLVGDRREDAVEVQPRLADRDHAVVGCQLDDLGPRRLVDPCRVVGMDPDRRIEPRKALDEIHGTAARFRVPARNQDPFHSGQPSRPDDKVDVAGEPVRLEVGVAIDQAHASDGTHATGGHRAPTCA